MYVNVCKRSWAGLERRPKLACSEPTGRRMAHVPSCSDIGAAPRELVTTHAGMHPGVRGW
eukprot:7282431-Pyramimonas_sp.AAC.1